MSLSTTVNRLRLAVARALIGAVDDRPALQTMQVTIQAGVVRDGVERFQQYGLTSVPLDGAESVTVSVGGRTDHQIVINVDDRRYRLRSLRAGEVALYDNQGQAVHLTRDGIVIRGAGLPMVLTDTPSITLDAPLVAITGSLQVDGNTDLRGGGVQHQGTNIGSQHQHGGVTPGGGNTGTPV